RPGWNRRALARRSRAARRRVGATCGAEAISRRCHPGRTRCRARQPRAPRTLGLMDTVVLDVDTHASEIVDLTDDVRRFCSGRGAGLCNVFAPHATAGIAIIETGARSEPDVVDALERLLPRDDRYRHAHGSSGHGADHVLPAIVAPTVSVPVVG